MFKRENCFSNFRCEFLILGIEPLKEVIARDTSRGIEDSAKSVYRWICKRTDGFIFKLGRQGNSDSFNSIRRDRIGERDRLCDASRPLTRHLP